MHMLPTCSRLLTHKCTTTDGQLWARRDAGTAQALLSKVPPTPPPSSGQKPDVLPGPFLIMHGSCEHINRQNRNMLPSRALGCRDDATDAKAELRALADARSGSCHHMTRQLSR
jgi:hypothetical protein